MPDIRARGIDVSSNQKTGSLHLHEWRLPLAFMWGRVSIGSITDGVGQIHILEAQAANYITGAYHALHEDGGDFRKQTRQFFGLIPKGCRLPPMADVERPALTAQNVVDFCDEWRTLTDTPLGIYTSANTWHQIMGTSVIAWARKLPLWNAGYPFDPTGPIDKRNNPPAGSEALVANTWKGKHAGEGRPDWDFWQHTGQGSLPGYSGDLDRDVFWGTEQQLREFVGEKMVARYIVTVRETLTTGALEQLLGSELLALSLEVPVDLTTPIPPAPVFWHDAWPVGLITVTPKPRAKPAAPAGYTLLDANGLSLNLPARTNSVDLFEKKILADGRVLFRVLNAPISGRLWWVDAATLAPA